ncbi:MAG: hypothetical protein AAB920_03370 [Patescibacteria group bacterium]
MKKDDSTDGARSEEIVIYRGLGIMGGAFVVRWHPKYGTVNVAYELRDGTRLGFPETRIPDITKKEFGRPRFRIFLDTLLDKLF